MPGKTGGRGPETAAVLLLVGEPPGDAVADDLLTLAEFVSLAILLFAPDRRRADGGGPTSLEMDQGISYPARPAAEMYREISRCSVG